MDFKIEWNLDESEALAQESLLGSIRFRNKEFFMEESGIYLDSWFEALMKAATHFVHAKNKEVMIEIPEESQPLIINLKSDGRVVMSFRGKSVDAESQFEFISELLKASGLFLKKIRMIKNIDKNASVKSVGDYWESLHSRYE